MTGGNVNPYATSDLLAVHTMPTVIWALILTGWPPQLITAIGMQCIFSMSRKYGAGVAENWIWNSNESNSEQILAGEECLQSMNTSLSESHVSTWRSSLELFLRWSTMCLMGACFPRLQRTTEQIHHQFTLSKTSCGLMGKALPS